MSNEIFSVTTPFPDVASLAQGYMNRADGERLLLPLAAAYRAGAGVRFVVYLEDGTPAFAGAGLCVQVSDQGSTVPADQRYETLLDTLQFDDRSRPVYDYIVAVRNAAYAQHQATEGGDEAVDAGADVNSVPAGAYAEEPTAIVDVASLSPADDAAAGEESASWGSSSIPAPSEPAAAPDELLADTGGAPFSAIPDHIPLASFVPPPLPTGLLTRPARTTHWQPAPPRRPTPRPASGMFRYRNGLPRPASPPRPDLDPADWITPATRPNS